MSMIINKNQIELIIKMINQNKVVAFPTETVYGMGVIAGSKEAYNELVRVKQRPETNPFTLMVSNLQMIEAFVLLSELDIRLIENFMPGEITLIFEKRHDANDFQNFDSIGIRMPKDQFILELIEKIGKPLLVTSANISGQPTMNDANQIAQTLPQVAAVVRGEIKSGVPSTVFDTRSFKILRQGNVTKKDLEEITGENSIRG